MLITFDFSDVVEHATERPENGFDNITDYTVTSGDKPVKAETYDICKIAALIPEGTKTATATITTRRGRTVSKTKVI